MDKKGITIEAVKEAVTFIEDNWKDWQGDFHEFMANVISDERVNSFDVKELVAALSEGEPIEGMDKVSAQKRGSNYIIKVNR